MDFDPYNVRTQADPSHQFGGLVQTNHGRDIWRYHAAGAANISKGKLEQAPAPVANHQNLALAAASNIALGSTQVSLTLGGTAATIGQYDQGIASVNAGTGLGQNFGINHSNAQTSTTGTVLISLDDPVYVALAIADSKVTLTQNPYNGVIETATKTTTPSGVSMVDVTALNFGWLKTRGIAGVLVGSAMTLGSRVTSDGSTAGAVTDNTDVSAPQTEVEIGQASIVAGTTGQYNPIVLTIG